METTTTGMKTFSLGMLLSGRRENYLIIERILRVYIMYAYTPGCLVPFTEFYYCYYYFMLSLFFFYEINNTISIQIYLYPNEAAF